MSRNMQSKTQRSAYLAPKIDDALMRHCRQHNLKPSRVIEHALKLFLFPEFDERRDRNILDQLDVLTDRFEQEAENSARQFTIIREMAAMHVKQFFFYSPEIPDDRQGAAVASGLRRFGKFLDKLGENLDPAKSLLRKFDGAEGSGDESV